MAAGTSFSGKVCVSGSYVSRNRRKVRAVNEIQNQFWESRERFADLVNVMMFHGARKVSAEDLRDADTATHTLLREQCGSGSKRRLSSRQRYRDAVRKISGSGVNMLVGLENQKKVHYAMPVRTMMLDALGYEAQLRALARRHRETGDLRGAEYLSGMSQNDRLIPVRTITVYYGKEEWNGAKSLHDFLEMEELTVQEREQFADYPLYLLDIHRFAYPERFCTDVREAIEFIQHSRDKKELAAYLRANGERFRQLPEETYDFIASVVHSEELEQLKKYLYREGETYDMCQAIKDLIEDGRIEGHKEGLAEGIVEGERLISVLAGKLLDAGRIADLRRMLDDDSYRAQLMKQMQV